MVQGFAISALAGLLITLHTTSPIPQIPQLDTNSITIDALSSIQTYAYSVAKGDSLTSIAAKVYGKEDYWTTLWNDNPGISDPTSIDIGQKFVVRRIAPVAVDTLQPELAAKLGMSPESVVQQNFATATMQLLPKNQVLVLLTPAPSVVQVVQNRASSGYDDVYKAAGSKYGIPWQILYGIHQAETGGRNGHILNGSGSGAQGPMQFMPGTFAAYHDENHPNIDNAEDAIYAAAKYLSAHGTIENGLISYGTNITAVQQAAASRGLTAY